MSTTTTTKRLHISGLTPAISATDLKQRFSSFGVVKALDGHGVLDGNGQPRRFAYVTIEADPAKIAKGVALLSGTTWKGTRLRIGDAKPDWRERFDLETSAVLKRQADGEAYQPLPTKKRRLKRGIDGVETTLMTLVTPDNVAQRPGWKQTTLSHLIRPIKMRPSHPLPPQAGALIGPSIKPKKLKNRLVPTRARRVWIDPSLYRSQHLTGLMLDADMIRVVREEPRPPRPKTATPASARASKMANAAVDAVGQTLQADKAKSLNILGQLFAQDDDWNAPADDFDDVGESMSDSEGYREDLPMVMQQRSPSVESQQPAVPSVEEHSQPRPQKVQERKLKDMFAPREDSGPFSLMKTLVLDLDLDLEDLNEDTVLGMATFPLFAPAKPALVPETNIASIPQSKPTVEFSARAPLFFPSSSSKATVTQDFFSVVETNGWAKEFCRTESPDEIRKRWEDRKLELTQDWKKRHREAAKKKKRGGADIVE